MSKRNQNIILNASSQEIGKQIQFFRKLVPVNFKNEIDKNYHIRALDSHLILSSSVGSAIALSGNFKFLGSGSIGPVSYYTDKAQLFITSSIHNHFIIMKAKYQAVGIANNIVGGTATMELTTEDSSANQVTRIIVRGGADDGNVDVLSGRSGSAVQYVVFNGTNRAIDVTNAVSGGYNIRATNSHLILSSSAGSRITVSGSLNIIPGSINTVTGGDANIGGVVNLSLNWPYNIRATNSHLILSSSAGSHVRISSSLGIHKVTTTSLPIGSVNMSGAIVWVNDVKQFAIYGPLGWTRILTGTVVG